MKINNKRLPVVFLVIRLPTARYGACSYKSINARKGGFATAHFVLAYARVLYAAALLSSFVFALRETQLGRDGDRTRHPCLVLIVKHPGGQTLQ
jgi:hypothetical protein